jgi:hypothetical protein
MTSLEFEKLRNKVGRKFRKPKSLKKICDDLWIEYIKLKAGHKSEISGKEGRKIGGSAILTSHHIVGKPNLRLRYELENGICLENGREHIFGVHNKFDTVVAKKYQDLIIKKIGEEKYNYLLSLRSGSHKIDLKIIKIYLEQNIANYRDKD